MSGESGESNMDRIWKVLGWVTIAAAVMAIAAPGQAGADDTYTVYSVYQALDLGNPNEVPQKDYYLSMGQSQGVRDGSIIEVMRKVPTYDLVSEKLYKEMTFPIARLKVIHVESSTAVARLEKLFPPEKTPALSPRAVMVGISSGSLSSVELAARR